MEVEKQHMEASASYEDFPARGRPATPAAGLQVSKRKIVGLVACLIALPLAMAVYNRALWNDQPPDLAVLEPAATGTSNSSSSTSKEKFLGTLLAPLRDSNDSYPKDELLGSPLTSPGVFSDSSNYPNAKHFASPLASPGVSTDSYNNLNGENLGGPAASIGVSNDSNRDLNGKHLGNPVASPGVSNDSFNGKHLRNPGASPGVSKNSSINGQKNKHISSIVTPDAVYNNSTKHSKDKILEASTGSTSHDSSNAPRDKTLGGLLAQGFDEASCVSRYNSVFYGKLSPHRPSPYLVERLRKYEMLHRRCGPQSKQYKRSMQQLKSGHNDGNHRCKYVVWLYSSGLGNRIVSLTSTFLYALLTDRVLLIDKNVDMNDLFCEPFPGSTWSLSHFPLSRVFSSSNPKAYQNILKYHRMTTQSLPLDVYFNLANGNSVEDRHFFCDEDQLFLEGIPWLVILSNQYFLPGLFQMPRYEKQVNQMFPDKETVFHHLGRYLLHPTNEVWSIITRVYESYLAKADTKLGIQVRVFNKQSMPYVTSHIVGCTLNEYLLPAPNAKEHLTQSKNNRTKAVLMASLYSTFYENIKSIYWQHPTTTGEIITVYQPSHDEKEQRGKKLHEMKALSEMFLLSMVDDLITSAISTFGYVAQGLGALKPWILNIHHTNTPKFPCYRAVSMEPCFHYPPYYDCKAKKIDINMPLAPYLTHCEDRKGGIKLVGKRT